MERSRLGLWIEGILVPSALYLLGFAVFSYPALGSFSTHLLADGWDGLQNTWNLWWMRRALLELHTSPWFTHELFHPSGVTLLGHTLSPFNGLLSIPLVWWLTPNQAYNVIVVFSFVASGTTCALLARGLGAPYGGSLFAGAVFTFGSYHWAHADGHLNLISLEWVPLFLLAWIRWLERPAPLRAALAAGALWLVLLSDYYYAAYCAVLGGVLFLASARRELGRFRERQAVASLMLFVALALATAGVHSYRLFRAHARDPFQDAHDPLEFSLDALALFVPGGHWRFADLTSSYWEQLPGVPVESSVYLGWTAIVPAAYAWGTRRREGTKGLGIWLGMAAGFALFALGPQLQIWGRKYPAVPMPYAFAERWFPPMRLTGVPVRMASVVLLCTALLASRGLAGFLRGLRTRAALLLFFVLCAMDFWPSPLPLTQPDVPDYYAALARLPAGAVHGPDLEGADVMYQQTLFQKPMSLGCISRRPQSVAARKEELDALVAEGRYEELMGRYQLRYLIAANPADGRVPAGLKAVFVGGERSIYVLSSDPLPAAAVSP
jgi:hypothetical protein